MALEIRWPKAKSAGLYCPLSVAVSLGWLKLL